MAATSPPATRAFAYRDLLHAASRHSEPNLTSEARRSHLTRSVSDDRRRSFTEAERDMTQERASLPSLRDALASGGMSLFVRELFGATSEEATFRCYICFEDVSVRESVTLRSCSHQFCRPCITAYLDLQINEGNVYPVCFHPTPHTACGVALDTDQIETFIESENRDKFRRFRLHKQHATARDCPYCSHTQVCAGSQKPTCKYYELRNAENEATSRAKIQKISKPCPGCRRPVEKNGGCNRLKCTVCRTNFCWLCGNSIDGPNVYAHFNATNGTPCSGRLFDGVPQTRMDRWFQIYMRSAIIVFGLPAMVLALLVAPLIACVMPRETFYASYERAFMGTFLTLQAPTFVVFFPLAFILLGVVSALEFVWAWRCRRRARAPNQPINPPRDLEAGGPPPRMALAVVAA